MEYLSNYNQSHIFLLKFPYKTCDTQQKNIHTIFEVRMMEQKKYKQKNHQKQDTISGGDLYNIRQNAHYSDNGKAEPDNNIFWEERSNPLSSKGN